MIKKNKKKLLAMLMYISYLLYIFVNKNHITKISEKCIFI